MANHGWLAVVDVHCKADSMAVASSSNGLVNVQPLVLIVVITSGCTGGPLVITAAAPPFLVLSLTDPYDDIVSLV